MTSPETVEQIIAEMRANGLHVDRKWANRLTAALAARDEMMSKLIAEVMEEVGAKFEKEFAALAVLAEKGDQ